jgi:hypothetical protein
VRICARSLRTARSDVQRRITTKSFATPPSYPGVPPPGYGPRDHQKSSGLLSNFFPFALTSDQRSSYSPLDCPDSGNAHIAALKNLATWQIWAKISEIAAARLGTRCAHTP